jgi:hypothetical protein
MFILTPKSNQERLVSPAAQRYIPVQARIREKIQARISQLINPDAHMAD